MGRFEWLKSVWSIIGAMIVGAAVGFYVPEWAVPMGNVGRLYIAFLIMCVPPIMLTAVSSSLARLITNEAATKYIGRMLLVFGVIMLAVSAVTVLAMHIQQPGATLSGEAQAIIGQLLKDAPGVSGEGGGWADLFLGIIPNNIFAAVAENNYPQILFVSVLLGLLLGFARLPAADQMVELAEAGFRMFQQAISWSTYVLPFAIVGIVAGQVAQTGFEIVFALAKLLAIGIAIAVLMLFSGSLLLAKVLGVPVVKQWPVLRRSILMGFGTSNVMAVMPLLMDAMADGFGLPRRFVNLVVPLSVLLARTPVVMYAGLMLMFTAQLYGIELTASNIVVLILAAVVGTIVGAGMPTIPFLTSLSVVAQPMGLPIEAVIPIFVALLPVLDPFGTAAGVVVHAAATATVIGGPGQTDPGPVPEAGVGVDLSELPAGRASAVSSAVGRAD